MKIITWGPLISQKRQYFSFLHWFPRNSRNWVWKHDVILYSQAFFELSLKMWPIMEYSDVICHSTVFFELSLKMWSIRDYSDVICHSTVFFELSLKRILCRLGSCLLLGLCRLGSCLLLVLWRLGSCLLLALWRLGLFLIKGLKIHKKFK